MRKFLKRFPFNKLFVSLFVILYTFVPYAQAIGTVIEDTSTNVDTSEDILDEGVSDPEEIANPEGIVNSEEVVIPEVLEEEVVEEPPFVYENGVYTVNSVGLEEYVYPDNKDVRIKFTNVTEEGNLVISKVTLTEQQKEELNTSDDYGWDISSSMSNGSFKYDLTLPNNTESNDVEVKYSEDGNNYESIDEVEVNENVIEIKGLEHFTLFVVSGVNNSGSCAGASITEPSGTTACYTTIQQAVNAASDGNTIYVAPGTYNEYVSIYGKAVNLIGSGADVTTINDPHTGAVITVENFTTSTSMTIEGFTISAETAGRGIVIQNSTSNVTVKNNDIINFTENGVHISNGDNNSVLSNTITTTSDANAGVYVDNDSSANLIDSNTITLPTSGSKNLYNIYFAGSISGNNTISNNILDGGKTSFQQDGGVTGTTTFSNNTINTPSFAGVYLNGGSANIVNNTFNNSVRPIEFWGANDITITDNVLDGTTHDFINIGSFTGTLNPIQHNAFLNMGGAKLHNRTTNDIIATENYWGDLDPSGNINNSGGGTIDYSPWWGEDYVGNDHSTGWTWYTNDSIQEAIDHSTNNDTIHITEGSYEEQLTIDAKDLTLDGDGKDKTFINSPDTLSTKYTTSNPNKPIVFIHNSNSVIQNITIDGLGRGNDNYRMQGISYYNARGEVNNVEIKNIKETPANGNQHGVGLYVYIDDGISRLFEADNLNIHDYQKNGTVFAGEGLTANINNSVIYGFGQIDFIAQNGIQYSNGATGKAEGNEIYNNYYTPSAWSATGILVYDAGDGLKIIGNDVHDNGGVGIYVWAGLNAEVSNNYVYDNWGDGIDLLGSGLESATIFNNIVENNDYGIWVDSDVPSNLVVYNNTFNNSIKNAEDYGNHYFDNGAIGNFWSDYDGIDLDGDGIGDTKDYVIDNDSSDRFPLTENYLSVDVISVETNTDYYKEGDTLSIQVEVKNDGSMDFNSETERLVVNITNPNNQFISGTFRGVYPLDLQSGETKTIDFYVAPQTIPLSWEEGTYRIYVSVYSNRVPLGYLVGGQDSGTTFIVDNTAPTQPTGLTIKDYQGNPLGCNGYTNNRTITVDWDDNTESDFDHYIYGIKDNEYFKNPWSKSFYSGQIRDEDGVYKYIVRAVDKIGNTSNPTDWCQVTLDRIAPTAEITSHTEGQLINEVQTISGKVEDLNLSHYWFVIYNSQNQIIAGPETVPNNGPTVEPSFNWDTRNVSDGEYIIKLEARDLANNKDTGSVHWVKVVVDNTPPEVQITSPLENTHISGIVDIKGLVTDNNLSHYNIAIYPAGVNVRDFSLRIEQKTENTSEFTEKTLYTWDTTNGNFPDGEYQIRLAARDLAGNRDLDGVSEQVITVIIDNTPPSTTLVNDPSGTAINEPILIQGTSTDTLSNVIEVTFDYRKTGEGDDAWVQIPSSELSSGENPLINPIPSGSWTWDVTWTPAEDGTYDIKVYATDEAGNIETSAYVNAVTYDTTSPEVLLNLVLGVLNILNITTDDLLSGIYTIQVSTDDINWVGYTPNSDMNLNDLVGNQPGTYTVYVRVTDNAGNVQEAQDTFTIPFPTPTTTQTAGDILGAIITPQPVQASEPQNTVPAQSPLGTGGYLLSQTEEQNTDEEEITEEETTTQDSSEVKGEEDNEEQNGEEEPTEEEKTKWWVYPLVIIPVLTIFLILWKRRKEDNEPQL